MPHVLVVGEDPLQQAGLVRALTEAGYLASSAATGAAGLHALSERPADLVLMDVSLPDADGVALLPRMRATIDHLPVIAMSARTDENHMIEALDAGADDYLVIPIGASALLARVRAVLRRAGWARSRRSSLVLGGLTVDPVARTAELEGRSLSLSPKEFDLLCYLAHRAGQVVTRRELLAEVWQMPYNHADRTVDVHVSWLRRKLRESGKAPRYLHTVRGVGLRLDVPSATVYPMGAHA
ncbi:DNA-binding response OmpR family regulator [Pseudonocardia eucalypti]|uniref:winged helix-turn-helix domain-containing protein n=1 Tax=Pseudonocardia eucalypti TaxID=648755 RepID=UPI0016131B1C|nr:DNA-binding response OmpR family regulator [Pseudonocardia eucalypti]